MGFTSDSVKNLPAKAVDAGLIPGSGRCSGAGNGNLLHYFCLENSMDRRACGLQSMGSQELSTTATDRTHAYLPGRLSSSPKWPKLPP